MPVTRKPIAVENLMDDLVKDNSLLAIRDNLGNVINPPVAKASKLQKDSYLDSKIKSYSLAIWGMEIDPNESAAAKKLRIEQDYHQNGTRKKPLFNLNADGELNFVVENDQTQQGQAAKNLNDELKTQQALKRLHYFIDSNDPDRYWVLWSGKKGGANLAGSDEAGVYCQFRRIGNQLHKDEGLPLRYENKQPKPSSAASLAFQPRFALVKRDTAANGKAKTEKVQAEFLAGGILEKVYQQSSERYALIDLVQPIVQRKHYNQMEFEREYYINEIIRLLDDSNLKYFNHMQATFRIRKGVNNANRYKDIDTARVMFKLVKLGIMQLQDLKAFHDSIKHFVDAHTHNNAISPNDKNTLFSFIDPVLKNPNHTYFDDNKLNSLPYKKVYSHLETVLKLIYDLPNDFAKYQESVNTIWKILQSPAKRGMLSILDWQNFNTSLDTALVNDDNVGFSNAFTTLITKYNKLEKENRELANNPNPPENNYVMSYFIPDYKDDLDNAAAGKGTLKRRNLLLLSSIDWVQPKQERDGHKIREYILGEKNVANIPHREQYAQAVVWRMFLHDNGVHNKNLGVNGSNQIVTFDNGPALKNICSLHQYNAFSHQNNWIEISEAYKHHFHEYGYRIMRMEEIADEMISAYRNYQAQDIKDHIKKLLTELHDRYSSATPAEYQKVVQDFLSHIGYEGSNKSSIRTLHAQSIVDGMSAGIDKNVKYYYFTKGLPLKIAHLFGKSSEVDFDEVKKFIQENAVGLRTLLDDNNKEAHFVAGRKLIHDYCKSTRLFNKKETPNPDDVITILQSILNNPSLNSAVVPAVNPNSVSQQTGQLKSLYDAITENLAHYDDEKITKILERSKSFIVSLQRSPTDEVRNELVKELKELNQLGLTGQYLFNNYNNKAKFILEPTYTTKKHNQPDTSLVTQRTSNAIDAVEIKDDQVGVDTFLQGVLNDVVAPPAPAAAGGAPAVPSLPTAALRTSVNANTMGNSPIMMGNVEVTATQKVCFAPFKHLNDATSALKQTAIVSSFDIENAKHVVQSDMYVTHTDDVIMTAKGKYSFPCQEIQFLVNAQIDKMIELSNGILPPFIAFDSAKVKDFGNKNYAEPLLKAYILKCRLEGIPFVPPAKFEYLLDPRSWDKSNWKDENTYSVKDQTKFGVFAKQLTVKEHTQAMNKEWEKITKSHAKFLKEASDELKSEIFLKSIGKALDHAALETSEKGMIGDNMQNTYTRTRNG